jgi:hypothetical protein
LLDPNICRPEASGDVAKKPFPDLAVIAKVLRIGAPERRPPETAA